MKIFITGASSGFGAAIAKEALRRGYMLGLQLRDLERFKREHPELAASNLVRTYLADVRDECALKAAVDAFASESDISEQSTNFAKMANFPKKAPNSEIASEQPISLKQADFPKKAPNIDVLINSAGLALGLGDFASLSAEDASEMIDTNIKGTLAAIRAADKYLQHGALVINLGSIAGRFAYPGGHVYCGTKAFVEQFSLSLRCDYAARGVRVSVIAPGLAKTNFSVTRFKGDISRADKVYEHTNYLTASDIAQCAFSLIDLPAHVNVNYLEVMPQTQTPAALNTAAATFGAQE